jgi:hypothetical protein
LSVVGCLGATSRIRFRDAGTVPRTVQAGDFRRTPPALLYLHHENIRLIERPIGRPGRSSTRLSARERPIEEPTIVRVVVSSTDAAGKARASGLRGCRVVSPFTASAGRTHLGCDHRETMP